MEVRGLAQGVKLPRLQIRTGKLGLSEGLLTNCDWITGYPETIRMEVRRACKT